MMKEKRKFVRTNGLVLVGYKFPELQIEGKTAAFDVSEAGVRLTVNRKIKIAALVEMEIYLPGDSQPIVAKGEVVWAKDCEKQPIPQANSEEKRFFTGIKFTVIDERGVNKISNYVYTKFHRG